MAGVVGVVAHGLGALGVLEALRRNDDVARSLGDAADRTRRSAAGGLRGHPPTVARRRTTVLDAQVPGRGSERQRHHRVVQEPRRNRRAAARSLPRRAVVAASRRRQPRGGKARRTSVAIAASSPSLAATAPRLFVVLGTAEATLAVSLSERTQDRSSRRRRRLDAQSDPLPESRVWFVPALHERLLLHPGGAATVADLLRNETSTRVARQPPATRPRRQAPPFVFPSQADLEGELMAADVVEEAAEELVLNVQVAHGSIDRLKDRPVLVGHYAGRDDLGGRGVSRLVSRQAPQRASSARHLPGRRRHDTVRHGAWLRPAGGLGRRSRRVRRADQQHRQPRRRTRRAAVGARFDRAARPVR